jgi:hypothetical protein
MWRGVRLEMGPDHVWCKLEEFSAMNRQVIPPEETYGAAVVVKEKLVIQNHGFWWRHKEKFILLGLCAGQGAAYTLILVSGIYLLKIM